MNAGWMFERFWTDPLWSSPAQVFKGDSFCRRDHAYSSSPSLVTSWPGPKQAHLPHRIFDCSGRVDLGKFNKNCSNKLRLKWISRIWRTEKTSGSIWPWPGGWLWQTKVIKLVWSPQHCFPSLSAHRSSTKVGPHLPWTVGGTSSEVWEIWTFSIIPLRPFLILAAH